MHPARYELYAFELCFLLSAHRRFIASAIRFLPSGVRFRLRDVGALLTLPFGRPGPVRTGALALARRARACWSF